MKGRSTQQSALSIQLRQIGDRRPRTSESQSQNQSQRQRQTHPPYTLTRLRVGHPFQDFPSKTLSLFDDQLLRERATASFASLSAVRRRSVSRLSQVCLPLARA